MVGGMSRIVRDVPPYMIVEGEEQKVYDINAIALRRLGVSRESRMALHKACKIMFKSRLALGHAIEIVRREVEQTQEVQDLLLYAERLYQGKLGRWRQV
jgi:UDP-N-acetylglucosamine acyltransferase